MKRLSLLCAHVKNKMELDKKLRKLENILTDYKKLLVALSGGVDSAFLLAFSHKVLGSKSAAAITASGPHLAQDEIDYAKRLCRHLGTEHIILNMDNILPIIEHNPADRCYFCKRAIFSLFSTIADEKGYVLADGTNLDDIDDYRPGFKALQELEISSPLKDAGLTKNDIRRTLHKLADENPALRPALMVSSNLPIWEKPAFACLASRIPYGESITAEKLKAIYAAEIILKDLGFRQVRVRHHGDVARIEVLPSDRRLFFDAEFMDKVNERIRECGFKFVALDLGGYRKGNLND